MSKRMKAAYKALPQNDNLTIEQVIDALKALPAPKFPPVLEIAIKLNIDSTKSDQNIRGAALMPAGLGKTIKIAVFAQGSYNKDAYDNGADYVIADQESAKDFINGPLDVDAIIATPDIMSSLMKWGVSKVIGPKGLMPNAKLDTVTFNIKKCIEDLRKGKAIFKNDKAGYLHAGIGKLTLETQALTENVIAFISGVEQAKPAVIKTNLIHSVWISASMCPAIKLNASQITRCIGNT